MWTAENRPRYNRDKLRYPSDPKYSDMNCNFRLMPRRARLEEMYFVSP